MYLSYQVIYLKIIHRSLFHEVLILRKTKTFEIFFEMKAVSHFFFAMYVFFR
jgi:hypothetical protein